MLLRMLHSKIHRATVTTSDLHYEGSLGIDRDFLNETGMIPGQQIDVLNVTSGDRFTTYIIEEPAGSKSIAVFGAAAHKAKKGDVVIIIAYAGMDEKEARSYQPKVIVLGEGNKIVERKVVKHG
ncbi:MAG: aspartate 1-decarboxylase [Alphaproteobacteria bacterium]|jgi:aspartate 1-decarboxylase